MEALLRADPAQSQRKISFGVATLQLPDGYAVGDFREHRLVCRESPPMRGRHAVEISPGTALGQRLGRITVDRQVERHQGRDAGRRQILGKIKAVAVHDVNRPLPQCLLDPVPMLLLSPAPQFLGEFRWKRSGGRSEERRVGKEWRSRWATYQKKKYERRQ